MLCFLAPLQPSFMLEHALYPLGLQTLDSPQVMDNIISLLEIGRSLALRMTDIEVSES